VIAPAFKSSLALKYTIAPSSCVGLYQWGHYKFIPFLKRRSKEQLSDLPLIVYYLQYFHLSIKDGCRKQLRQYSEQRGGPDEWEIWTFLRDYIREGMVTPFSLQNPVTLSWLKAFGMEIMALRDVDSFIEAWNSWAFYLPLCIQGQFNMSILVGKKAPFTNVFFFFLIFEINSFKRVGCNSKNVPQICSDRVRRENKC